VVVWDIREKQIPELRVEDEDLWRSRGQLAGQLSVDLTMREEKEKIVL